MSRTETTVVICRGRDGVMRAMSRSTGRVVAEYVAAPEPVPVEPSLRRFLACWLGVFLGTALALAAVLYGAWHLVIAATRIAP